MILLLNNLNASEDVLWMRVYIETDSLCYKGLVDIEETRLIDEYDYQEACIMLLKNNLGSELSYYPYIYTNIFKYSAFQIFKILTTKNNFYCLS